MTRRKDMTPQDAFLRLADRCSTTEICTAEALDKLRQWGIGDKQRFEIVQRLVDERFIDDERFARAFVRDCLYNSRWGMVKIRQALRLKHLDSAFIDNAIESEFDEECYFANLASALRSKGRNMASPLGRDDKIKLMRFALSRGYEPGLVGEMLADEEYWRDEEAI